ncbi:MAG: archaetidylserine decarboxylase [Lysobacterales bacterium]
MSAFVVLQYLLPHRLLSALARALTRARWVPLKNALISMIASRFGVDWSEAESAELAHYPHFNAFFTRALKPGARPADPDPGVLLMPADGRISQLGAIRDGRVFQAKGFDFSAAELLASADAARPYRDGLFATIYLSPRDYHRVHLPWASTLIETRHVPGRLFSVSPATVAAVPRLFARNERLVCRFETDFGELTLVMVGALLVSGVETVWDGVAIPPYARRVVEHDHRHRQPAVDLQRGAEMARFNYGSTVIVLLPPGVAELDPTLGPGSVVRVGQALARRRV